MNLIALIVVGGLAVVFALYMRARQSPPYPPAESFITPPQEDATIARTDDGDYRLVASHPPQMVYAGAEPSAIDRSAPLALVLEDADKGMWRVNGAALSAYPRPCFEVQFANGSALKIAERILTVEGAANFRDIGGYPTHDGKRVRWGLLYRSGMLANLTENGRAMLDTLNIRWVCDLRLEEETAQNPDRVRDNPNIRYAHKPVVVPDDSMRRLRVLLFDRKSLPKLMLEGYTVVGLDNNARLQGDILRELTQPGALPALIHCTAGKDRTGTTVMLLLMALGVPEEIIIADYSLSNHYFHTFRAYTADTIQRLRWFGLNADSITPLLVSDPAVMRATLDYLRAKYGSADAYLRTAAGLTEADIAALRAVFLE